VGGLISTESKDRQQETVLQRGLDFSNFLRRGRFNENHERGIDAIIGRPEFVEVVEKGSMLPNGQIAPARATWCEGWLLEEDERADKIWKKAMSLAKSDAQDLLGWSIEGGILKRAGPDFKTIAKAVVSHVAITADPVNTDTRLDVLAKSLAALEAGDEATFKALTYGSAEPGESPIGPKTGAGAGRIITRQSLETGSLRELRKKKRKKRSMTKAEAFHWLERRYPTYSASAIGRILDRISS